MIENTKHLHHGVARNSHEILFCFSLLLNGCIGSNGEIAGQVKQNSIASDLSVKLSQTTIGSDESVTILASGGVPPYTYAIGSGGGSLTGATYTAHGANGATASIVVQDSAGKSQSAPLQIINLGYANSQSNQLKVNETLDLTPMGGLPPYNYKIMDSGAGTMVKGSTYQAPSFPTTVKIHISDSGGQSLDRVLTVTSGVSLTLSPAESYLYLSEKFTFTTQGGNGAIVYAITSGGSGGSIDQNSGLYVAGTNVGDDKIQACDQQAHCTQATVHVRKKLKDNFSKSFKYQFGALMTFNFPGNRSTYFPAFEVGGINDLFAAEIPLGQFLDADPAPYAGSLYIIDSSQQNRTFIYDFCVSPIDESAYIHLSQWFTGLDASSNASPSNYSGSTSGLKTSSGQNLVGLKQPMNLAPTLIGNAIFKVVDGYHRHDLKNCSQYQNFQMRGLSDH